MKKLITLLLLAVAISAQSQVTFDFFMREDFVGEDEFPTKSEMIHNQIEFTRNKAVVHNVRDNYTLPYIFQYIQKDKIKGEAYDMYYDEMNGSVLMISEDRKKSHIFTAWNDRLGTFQLQITLSRI